MKRPLPFAVRRARLADCSDPDACWTWRGYLDRDGYGSISWAGRYGVPVHRVAYEQEHGPIADGLTIDHLCRNRACINPAHLEAVSHLVNMRRSQTPAMRIHRSGRCGNGHERNDENTRYSGGRWHCRPCEAERTARYLARKESA